MKFLLGIVSLVAVFAVNGQGFHKEYAIASTGNEADGQHIFDHSFEESQSLFGGFEMKVVEEQAKQIQENDRDQERTLRRSRCKARNACVVMGGFCVTNATLCGGRLVPEGCKGTNCQCCVPGTIETRFDNLERELQSLKISLNTDLQDLRNNMNTSDSHLNREIKSLKNNMNTSFSNVNAMLENRGCPEGLFFFAPSNQCFRVLKDKQRNWNTANTACQALGLQLALPYDPVSLTTYLVTRYGLTQYTWIGARGDSSYIRWQRNRKAISNSNSFWSTGRPSSDLSSSICLELLTTEGYLKSEPNKPYYNIECSNERFALCELVTE